MGAQDQLYQQYADIPALEEQTAKILKMFDDVETGMKRLSDFGIKINTGQSVKQVENFNNEVDALGETVKKQQKQIVDMAVKLAALNTEEAKQAEALKQVTALTKGLTAEQIKNQKIRQGEYEQLQQAKQANNDLNKSIQLRIKIRNAEEGSIEQLSLKSQKLLGIINKLSDTQRNSDRGQALVAQSKALSDQVNTLKKGAGDFKNNIGRYAESLGGLFDNVRSEIQRLKQEQASLQQQQGVDPAGFASRGGDAQIQRVNTALNQLVQTEALANKEGISFVQVQRQIERQFQNMSASGAQSNEFLQQFKLDAAKAKDEAGDLKEEIKALSSDTRSLDLLAGSVHVVASSFEAISGLGALFGSNSNDIARATQKLIAIQSVANGVREVAEQVTKRGTAANKAYNFVLEQGTQLFGKGKTAAERFNAVLKFSGIGIAIAAIGFLADKLGLFGDDSEEVKKEVDKLTESLEKQGKVVEELGRQYDYYGKLNIERIKQQQALQTKPTNELAAAKQESKNRIEIQESELETLRKQQEIANEESLRAGQKASDARLKLFQYQQLKQSGLNSLRKVTVDGKSGEQLQQEYEATKKYYQERYDASQAATEKLNTAEAEFRTADLEDEQKTRELKLAKIKKYNEDERKAALELFKFRQGLIIEQKDFESSDDALGTASGKIAAARASAQAQIAIIKEQQKFDLKQKDITASQIKLINEKSAHDTEEIQYKLSSRIIAIYVNEKNERLRIAQESSDDFDKLQQAKAEELADRRQKALDKEQKEIETNRDEDLRLNAENFEKGFKNYEGFQARRQQILDDSQRIQLQSQLRFYKESRDLAKENGDDTTEIDAAIANAEAALAEARIDAAQKAKEAIKGINDEIKKNYIDTFMQIGQAFVNVFGAIAEKRKQDLQDEMDKIDERKEKEIEAVTSSAASEETKAAKIKIIEARAQADKDQRERKQRQIDRQNAILERAFKVFQVTTDTILAVNKIQLLMAATPPTPIGIAQKALLASQLVLAIASGAANLTAIFAAPLPKYARGGTVPYDQYAEVGEEGTEMSVDNKGKLRVYDKRQVAYLTKGTKIYPAQVTKDILNAAHNDIFSHNIIWQKSDSDDFDYSLQRDMLHELKTFNRRPPFVLNIAEGIEATPHYQKQIKH